jgi:hypothetical protein
LLVTDNRDVLQQFSDFIMSSYMAFMAFMADIQIPVLMGNSEWHWPSGWDSPGTAASWGSLDVVGWQTWSLNTDLELRLYDIQQFREVFVFKHKDAVYYPLFDSGVLKLKKFENIYSFDPSFDISKSQFFLNYFFDLSFFTSENTTRLFHKTWALSSAPSNWYPRSIKDLPPVLNMDGLSAPVSNFLKALYGGGAGSAASENVVAAPEPAKPELTPEQMRA